MIISIATSLLQLAFESDSFQARTTSISSTFGDLSFIFTQCSGMGRPKSSAMKSSFRERSGRSET